MDLAIKVKKKREELGLSQEELAIKMGYSSRTSINKIENGRPCSQKIIARLADALGTSVSYLMGWDEEAINALATEQEEVINSIMEYDEKIRQFAVKLAELELNDDELDHLYEYAKFMKRK